MGPVPVGTSNLKQKGGDNMDIVLVLMKEAAKVFIRIFISAAANALIERLKKRTAPTHNRDGHDIN